MPILNLKKHKDNLALFVSEAKRTDLLLEEYLPQVAGEMYACGKALGLVIHSFHAVSHSRTTHLGRKMFAGQ